MAGVPVLSFISLAVGLAWSITGGQPVGWWVETSPNGTDTWTTYQYLPGATVSYGPVVTNYYRVSGVDGQHIPMTYVSNVVHAV
jgi:hypothetical protein